ncbi:MAG: sulfatase-like hydrolase/transferase [Planctomycetota bacterium]|nr:sulfatase-like hydrolase/transferase [Planctomycetota bacterium]
MNSRIALSVVLLSVISCSAASHAAAKSSRPNVLFICADDHAAYVTGAYGNKLVRTPNIDRLAQAGIRFDRAYSNAPICSASRASFITGRYPRTVGVTQLRTPLPESETTLADILKAAGYDTAAIGKTHFNSGLKHGYDSLINHPQHRQWLKRRGAKPLPKGVEVLPKWKPFRDHARIWLNGMYDPFGAVDADMPGTFFARRAAAFVEQKRDRPFFLFISFYEPHSPFRFPVEYAGRHDPGKFPVAKVGPGDGGQIPAIFRDLTDAEKQGITAAYYTSTEFMDKNVGLVLEALRRSGKADNTLVVYIGDHGYMLGHHGRFEKHCSFEQANRTPLLLSYPGKIAAGRHTEAMTEFIDIVPTVLDFCELPTPGNVQGRSLAALAAGKTDSHRRRIFVEYAQNDEVMVRDERWKLVFIRGKRRRDDGYDTRLPLPGHKLKLYDLKNDPEEMHNLAGEAEQKQRVDHYVGLLVDFLKRTSRQPELIPKTDDPMVILDHCVQPRDVVAKKK